MSVKLCFKAFLLFLIFISSAVVVNATDIQVSGMVIPNWQNKTTPVYLRISNDPFIDNNGVFHPGGVSSFTDVPLTLNAGAKTLTVPTITLISTTNSLDNQNARYRASIVDNRGRVIQTLNGLDNFSVPDAIASNIPGCSPVGTCATWTDLRLFNNIEVPFLDRYTYTDRIIDSKISALMQASEVDLTPFNFVVKTPNALIPNAFALSTLGNGLLKNQTGTGNLSIAQSGVDYELPLAFNGSHFIRSGNFISLNTTGVIAGNYNNASISIDALGRITSAANGSTTGGTWGTISGSLSSQTDLQNTFNTKLNKAGDTLNGNLVFSASTYPVLSATSSGTLPSGAPTNSVAITTDLKDFWLKSPSGWYSLTGGGINIQALGAKGDVISVTDGSTGAGSNVITCSLSAPFTPSVVNMIIDVSKSGASQADLSGTVANNNQTGTITAYISPTQVQVSFNASVNSSNNVVTFGTDNSAILTLVNSIATQDSVINIPRGNYAHSIGITALSGQTIKGDGPGVSTLTRIGPARNDSTAWNSITIPDGTNNVTLKDFSIKGTNLNALRNVNVAGIGNGVILGTGATGKISKITFENFEVSNTFGMGLRSNGDVPDQLGQPPGVEDVKILASKFIGNADNGVNLNTGGGLWILGSTMNDNGVGGVEFAGGRLVVADSEISGNRQVGIAVGGLGNPSVGKDLLIHHNRINKNGTPTAGGSGMQIGGNVIHVAADYNIIRDNFGQGIGVTDGTPDFASLSRDIRLTYNDIISNGTPSSTGIGLSIGMDGVLAEHNNIFDDNTPGHEQKYGILAAGENAKVLRNDVYGNTTRDYSFERTTNLTFAREDTTSVIYISPAAFSGTVDTSGTNVTYKSGDMFSQSWSGLPIVINSVTYTISSVSANATGLCNTAGQTLTRTSGPSFNASWVGKYIKLGEIYFLIATVPNANTLTVSNTLGVIPGTQTEATWELRGSTALTISSDAGTQTNAAYTRASNIVYPAVNASTVVAQGNIDSQGNFLAGKSGVDAFFRFRTGLAAGMITEASGAILSYGINVPQTGIGDGGRDTTKSGGLFRLDARGSVDEFVVYGYPIGTYSANRRLSVSLENGNTTLLENGGVLTVSGRANFQSFFNLSPFTPSSTSDGAGNVNDIAHDDGFVYVKTSAGWKRAALSTF